MIKLILYALATLAAVQATGDFLVLHSPDSVRFDGAEPVDQSLLTEVFSAALGFTVKQRGTWSGISITNPFELPEAVVGIAVEGVDSLESPRGKRFPLNVDEVEETTWQALSGRLEERSSNNDNTLVRIYLGDGLDALGQSALGELKPTAIAESSLNALSLKNEEDRKFLEEVQLLHAIAKKVPSAIKADSKPDVYWFVMSGLPLVLDLHGSDSVAAKEALSLLNDALSDVSKAFMDVYDDKVLIAAFTNNASQVRHTRAVDNEPRLQDGNNEIKAHIDTSSETKSSDGSDSSKNNEPIQPKNTDSQNNIAEKGTGDGGNRNNTTTAPAAPTVDDKTLGTTENNVGHNNISNSHKSPDKAEIQDTNSSSTKQYTSKSDVHKKPESPSLNLSKKYTENYPVIFNILLWFGVIFVFSLLAICIAIADMDPGRDSIIYRMTSNRMKKDN